MKLRLEEDGHAANLLWDTELLPAPPWMYGPTANDGREVTTKEELLVYVARCWDDTPAPAPEVTAVAEQDPAGALLCIVGCGPRRNSIAQALAFLPKALVLLAEHLDDPRIVAFFDEAGLSAFLLGTQSAPDDLEAAAKRGEP